MKAYLKKSLQQLEGDDWGNSSPSDTDLVQECTRLHRMPLEQFTISNLRIMIGQNVGLEYLVPMALEKVQEDPFIEADFYPCDLLVSLLKADSAFWKSHSELRNQLRAIAEQVVAQFASKPDVASRTVTRTATNAFKEFTALAPNAKP